MNPSMEFANKTALAYSTVCKPLCQELGLSQTALDILLFLANNPDYKTASEIVEIRRLKANLVSVNVEKLVQEGYLTRCAVAGDRRKTELLCTEKAAPILARGRQLQKDFSESLFAGMDEARREAFAAALVEIESNLDAILEANEP
jgi:DNA-binding MarR family transcriptional regulator